jgi:hypothetical protein
MNVTMNQTDDGSIVSSYSLPSDNSVFVRQSIAFDPTLISSDLYILRYFSFALAAFVILQSSYLNGRKMNYIRFCSDACAVFVILYEVFFIIADIHPNATKSSICYDFFQNGMFILIIQLFDNYLFY